MAIEYSKLDPSKITEKNLASLNKLLQQLSHGKDPIDANKLSWMLSKYNTIVHLAIDTETQEIVGMGSLLHNEKLTAKFGTIEDVVVNENHRGQGIGRKITENLIENGKQLGLKYIELTSKPHRIAANELYKKIGFIPKETNVYRMVF